VAQGPVTIVEAANDQDVLIAISKEAPQ